MKNIIEKRNAILRANKEKTGFYCSSCSMLSINGQPCHESGCPDAWQTEIKSCHWCGSDFIAEKHGQQFCDYSCYAAYSGLPESEE